jgi:hypothetical protein
VLVLVQVASTGGIVLDTCKSVTLKGSAILTYQWDQYPYAQGTLLNVTEDQVNLTVQVGICEHVACLLLHTDITHPGTMHSWCISLRCAGCSL